ncbi:MAG: hypothetical protein ACRCXK_09620, partial [Wohlfahrtiimonas sp.]
CKKLKKTYDYLNFKEITMIDKTDAQKAIDETNQQREKYENNSNWIGKIKVFSTVLIIAIGFYSIVIYKKPENQSPQQSQAQKNDDNINMQFNKFSGEHVFLRENAKNSLKFPATYKHIETKYIKNEAKGFITVRTWFTGENAVGAVSEQCIMARYNFSGVEIKPPSSC